MKTKRFVPWFGADTTIAPYVAESMAGCRWVGVPFAGGMSAVLAIGSRTMLVNDIHRHVVNLARVVADDDLRPILSRRLKRKLVHPDELRVAQAVCRTTEPGDRPDLGLAEAYFVTAWMGRSSIAGIDDEYCGRTAVRWNANGGDSAVRYQNAVRSLVGIGASLRRCTFETMDAFEFLIRCEDEPGHGLYCDPPFPGAGRRYKHNAGKTDSEERQWHEDLSRHVDRFTHTRVVMRFYDHPLIRELYPESRWSWRLLSGRTQANKAAAEVLLTRG